MENLWAPWRAEYILNTKKGGCFLCQKPKEDRDEENFILYRGKTNFIILNSYPYNPGHLLIAPYRHVDNLQKLTDEESKEHFALLKLSIKLLTKVTRPQGFNIGMNLGKVSGAGLDDHLHTHVVPRWLGDTNFMTVTSNTKVVSQGLADTYRNLKKGLTSLL
jgi:ATP adenylyltransferase